MDSIPPGTQIHASGFPLPGIVCIPTLSSQVGGNDISCLLICLYGESSNVGTASRVQNRSQVTPTCVSSNASAKDGVQTYSPRLVDHQQRQGPTKIEDTESAGLLLTNRSEFLRYLFQSSCRNYRSRVGSCGH